MMVRPLVRHLTPSFIIRSSGRAAALVVAFAAAHCLTAALFSSFSFDFKKTSNSRRTRKRQSTKMRYNPVASHTIQGKYPPRMKIQEKRAEPAPPSTPKVHTKGKEKRTTNGKKNWKKKKTQNMWTSLLLRWWLPLEKTVEKKTPIGDEDVFPIVTIHFQQEGRNENTKKFQKEEDEKNIWGAGLPIITIFSWEIHKLDCVTLAKREPVTTNVVRSFFFFYGVMLSFLKDYF